MRWLKSLMLVVMMSVLPIVVGQTENSIIDRIDFNDAALIDSDTLRIAIAKYIDSSYDKSMPAKDAMYDMILAADNVLSRACTTYEMYSFVYQYLIYGFSEMGANMVVDYMTSLPYFEFVVPDDKQRDSMREIAESYQRVKIGTKAPQISSVTVDGEDFNLYDIKSDYTLLFFWSPACPHCKSMIKELAKMTNKDNLPTIVTVSVSKEKKKAVKLLKRSRLNGYHICDGYGWNSRIIDDYAIDMTPALILLDEDKVIINKPFDIKELKEFLEL